VIRKKEYADSRSRLNVLRRTANEVKSYYTQKRILLTALSVLLTLTCLIFMGAALHHEMGRLTIGVDKEDSALYNLVLSETEDMEICTPRLNAEISERITNISVDDLPGNLNAIDGQHNGENYVAYTFYLQNRGTEIFNYDYNISISGVTQGLDEAIRIRLYIDGEYTDYAKTKSDGTGAEPNTTEFYSHGIVTKGRVKNYQPMDKTKYTLVIWIEGDDPDCVDRLIEGKAKIEMDFRVILPDNVK
jgi:hypothetical protein